MEEGKSVFLLGFTCASESIEIALNNISMTHSDHSGKPQKEVLFVIRIWNVSNYPGFRLNQPIYSPFCHERDHVLPQEMMVWLYGLEEIEITNLQINSVSFSAVTAIYVDAFNY